jgi:hypothetical protein
LLSPAAIRLPARRIAHEFKRHCVGSLSIVIRFLRLLRLFAATRLSRSQNSRNSLSLCSPLQKTRLELAAHSGRMCEQADSEDVLPANDANRRE